MGREEERKRKKEKREREEKRRKQKREKERKSEGRRPGRANVALDLVESVTKGNTRMIGIFTVFDVKAEAYLQPFFAHKEALALRMFTEAASDPDHQFCKHAEDYTLFAIGEWEENSGEIQMYDVKKPLGNALQFTVAPHLVEGGQE